MSAGHPPILLIGDSLNLGGTEGQFAAIACGLARAGWNMHATCLRAQGPLRATLEAAGLRPWCCGPGSFKSPRFPLAIWRLTRYIRAHGIRLVHSFDFYSNVLGVPAARFARVPVIASQRDLGNLRPPLQCRVQRMVLRLADYILVNSPAVAERVIADPALQPGRIAVIPNGVDLARFSRTSESEKPSPGRITVGTVTNLRPEKGLLDLVQAAALVRAQFRETRFVVWGEGPTRPELERMLAELGLGTVFELRGPTMTPEVVLRELDIFVLPSLSEASSNSLLEAMASGVAVVATRVGGNPAIVEDEVTGLLVPPGDPAALAKAIIRLIEDPSLTAALAAQGRNRVHVQLGMDAMLARVQELYRRVLAGGGR